MTKGLRCSKCDTTINRKVVLDYILNKNGSYLHCSNTFCNVRWRRAALEANKAMFLSDAAPKAPDQKKKVEKKVETTVVRPKKVSRPKSRPIKVSTTWLERMRTVAKNKAKVKGVVSVDELRLWADLHDDHPTSNSAWGSVFQNTEWSKVSERPSTYKASRSRKVSVWAHKTRAAIAV